MLLRPALETATMESAGKPLISVGPPPWPPSPCSPWQATHASAYSWRPWSALTGRAAAGAAARPGPKPGPPLVTPPTGSDFIVPFSENIQMPSPRGAPANTPPPACTTTRWSPCQSNVVTVVFTPASVRNSHSDRPLLLSSAARMPRSLAAACTKRPPMYTSLGATFDGSSACTLNELMRSVAQTYRRCVSGSYELGGQFAPPIVPGFIAIGSVQNGVKILPSFTTDPPLGTMLEPSGGMSIDCGTIAS